MISEKLRMKSEEYKFGEFEGITLISLVITIIILIILAGVTINLSISENGIFYKAKEAKEETNKQVATEKINLKITTAQINKYAERQEMPTLKELSLALKEDDEIEYVTEKSQIASTKYEVQSENPNSIYTKLNQYPYEFEINGQLQLASINGIKIASSNVEELEKRIANLERQVAELTKIKKATITKSSAIKELTVNSFCYNNDSAKLSISVKLNSTLKSGESVVIGNINEKEAWPLGVSACGVGYYNNRTLVMLVKHDGEISVRNASTTDLTVASTDNAALSVNIYYPLFN